MAVGRSFIVVFSEGLSEMVMDAAVVVVAAIEGDALTGNSVRIDEPEVDCFASSMIIGLPLTTTFASANFNDTADEVVAIGTMCAKAADGSDLVVVTFVEVVDDVANDLPCTRPVVTFDLLLLSPQIGSKCFNFHGSNLIFSFSASMRNFNWFSGVNSPSANRSRQSQHARAKNSLVKLDGFSLIVSVSFSITGRSTLGNS